MTTQAVGERLIASARFRFDQRRRRQVIRRESENRQQARELIRLSRIGPRKVTTTNLLGAPFQVPDVPSFLQQYDEIFRREHMRFETVNPEPLIIDAGANAGVATRYFKRLYPRSRILAFEPDPFIADLLRANVGPSCVEGVEVREAAIWSSAGKLPFWSEGTDSGRLGDVAPAWAEEISVRSVRLADFLGERIELLKLDIEGAECEALIDAAPQLENVERVWVEYHSVANRAQELGRLLDVLGGAGFRYFVQQEFNNSEMRPFIDKHEVNGFDNQLVVSAHRRHVR